MNMKILIAIVIMLLAHSTKAEELYSGIATADTPQMAKKQALNLARESLLIKLGAPIYLKSSTKMEHLEQNNNASKKFSHTTSSYLSVNKISFTGEEIISERISEVRRGLFKAYVSVKLPMQSVIKIRELIKEASPKIIISYGEHIHSVKSISKEVACTRALSDASGQAGMVNAVKIGEHEIFQQTSSFKLKSKKHSFLETKHGFLASCRIEIELL